MKTVSLMIHDSRSCLAASTIKTRGKYSGIGGKIENTDLMLEHSILREFGEELFNIDISVEDMNNLIPFLSRGYVSPKYDQHMIFFMTYDNLTKVLKYLAPRYWSILYTKFPTNIIDLLFERNDFSSELLSLVQYSFDSQQVQLTKEFISDIQFMFSLFPIFIPSYHKGWKPRPVVRRRRFER